MQDEYKLLSEDCCIPTTGIIVYCSQLELCESYPLLLTHQVILWNSPKNHPMPR